VGRCDHGIVSSASEAVNEAAAVPPEVGLRSRRRGPAGVKPTEDLAQGRLGFAFWCVGVVALIVGLVVPNLRTWLWIPAFLVMGIACVANAARCRRTHCYLTGPVFLAAAVYVGLSVLHLVPLYAGALLDIVLAATLLAFLAELPLGKYR
jgi:hypothetical protein